MPEKLQPFFRQKQPKQPKQPNQPNQSLNDQQSSQATYNPGPNLILQQVENPSFYYYASFGDLFRKISLAIVLFFGILLCVNIFYDLKLASQKIILDQLTNQAGQFTQTALQAQDVDTKTKFYLKTLTERNILGDKANAIFSNLNNRTNLLSASINLDRFEIVIEVPSPFDFAKLVSAYLSNAHIAQVSLNSADLITGRGVYRVVLNGTYK